MLGLKVNSSALASSTLLTQSTWPLLNIHCFLRPQLIRLNCTLLNSEETGNVLPHVMTVPT